MDTLNRITTIFLETAELRVKRKMDQTLLFWQATVDDMLRSNLYEVLTGPGHVGHEKAVEVSNERYDAFDERRKQEEARLADEADMAELRKIEEEAKKRIMWQSLGWKTCKTVPPPSRRQAWASAAGRAVCCYHAAAETAAVR